MVVGDIGDSCFHRGGSVGLTFLGKVVPGSPFPDGLGLAVLGARLLTFCPLLTHAGLWVWVGVEFDADSGDVWEGMWETDGAGIWLAFVTGIGALIGASATAKRPG